MQKTKIEYLTYTWNPIAMRCTPVSDGCRNCWHLAMAKRLAKNPMIDEGVRASYAGGIPALNNKELEAPLHLRKPARIGVQFMGDVGHDSISDRFIAEIWDIMTRCPEHTFFILIKRPGRLLKWSKSWGLLPFPNVYLGVSVENQKTADERIPILLQIPAAKRFVSVEPMLGEINLGEWLGVRRYTTLDGFPEKPYWKRLIGTPLLGVLDWVICGGESGPGARPLHPDWVRFLRDQCQAAGVPLFFKSWGDVHKKYSKYTPDPYKKWNTKVIEGPLLDGKEYREFPK